MIPGITASGGPKYDLATVAYVDAMTVKPDTARIKIIDQLIRGLKSDGVWEKLTLLYLLASHDEQAAKLNVIDPSIYPLVAENSPTFTVDSGFNGDGSTQALHVDGYDASTGTFLDSHVGLYNVATAGAGGNDIGLDTGGVRWRITFKQNGTSQINLYSASSYNYTVGGPAGSRYFCAARNTSLLGEYSIDGIDQGTYAQGDHATTATTIALLRAVTNYTVRKMHLAHVGTYLDSAQRTALFNRFNSYLSSIGALE